MVVIILDFNVLDDDDKNCIVLFGINNIIFGINIIFFEYNLE